MMQSKRYLVFGLVVILLLFAALLALATLIDPYYVFAAPTIKGVNELKPRVYQQIEIAKPALLERSFANTLVLGNSRFEIGIDPSSRMFPMTAQPVFNGAISGHNMFAARRLLQDAIAVHRPMTVIVGLDFPDYLRAQQDGILDEVPIGPLDSRLLVDRNGNPNPNRRWQTWIDRLTASMTIGALFDSVETFFDQDTRYSVTMTTMGFDPLNEYRLEVRRIGEHGLFAQKDAVYQAEYASYHARNFSDTRANSEFQELTALIRTAARSHIHVELVIYPYHASYLEMLHKFNLWDSFCAWKWALVSMVDEEQTLRGADVRLWDFSGYNDISQERIPARGDRRSETRWYWEAGHFKSALGDQILARVYGKSSNFGTEVDLKSLEQDIREIDRSRLSYLLNTKGDGSD